MQYDVICYLLCIHLAASLMADTFLTSKFWACKPFSFDTQVFKQTLQRSHVSLGCCLKHSLSCERFSTNIVDIHTFLSEK